MIKINLLKKNEARATTYYVDLEKGRDSNDGLSTKKPLKTFWKAIELCDRNKDDIEVRSPGLRRKNGDN